MYPAFTKDVEATHRIMANLPVAVRAALDISLQNFFTIYGFFSYLLTFAALAGAVQAMNLGVGVISKEESGKTADFLLTKPISRTKIFASKIASIFSVILFTNVVFDLVSYVTARLMSEGGFDNRIFGLILLTFFLIQLLFLALGLLLSLLIPKIKSSIAVTLPAVFLFFVIGMLGSIIGNENVRYICPFKFFESNYIIDRGALELKYLLIEMIVVIIATILSYLIFIRKDIRAAA